MKYSESGNGFSYSNDAAKTAVLHAAEISPVNVALRDFNTSLTYRLLSRKKKQNITLLLLKSNFYSKSSLVEPNNFLAALGL
jgi:hypothetical protein